MSRPAELAAGSFYSGVAAHKERPRSWLLTELVQPTPRTFPMHHHERDYFFLVLGGDYREGDGRKTLEFRGMTAGFNPRFVPHAGEAGRRGTRMFTVEFAPEFVADSGVDVPADPVSDFGVREMVWTGLRMFRCFRQAPPAGDLSYESIACELLGALPTKGPLGDDDAPLWLRRAIDQIHAHLAVGCSITGLAREAGVHPVHLARVFRKRTGVSPGEYLQRIRADRACDLLINSELPLTDVAAECGFYDQSHMTRLLHRYAGATPKVLRRLTLATR